MSEVGNGAEYEISPIVPEEIVQPEPDAIDPAEGRPVVDGLLRYLGLALRPSKTGEKKRPLWLRQLRRGILRDVQGARKSGERDRAWDYVTSAERFDKAYEQMMKQKEISLIDLEIGKVTGRYTTVDIDERLAEGERPIVYIGGYASDIKPSQGAILAMGAMGKPVIALTYPEGTQGLVDEKYVEKVKRGEPYEAQAKYFKKAIEAILEDINYEGKIDLWGQSTGAGVVAKMLTDGEFFSGVERGAIINPVSQIDQSVRDVQIGAINDIVAVLPKVGKLLRNTLVGERDDYPKNLVDEWPADDHMKKLKSVVHKVESEWVSKRDDSLDNAKVTDDGVMLVVSCGNDKMTKTSKRHDDFVRRAGEDESFKYLEITNGIHSSLFLDPVATIQLIDAAYESDTDVLEAAITPKRISIGELGLSESVVEARRASFG